MAQIVDTISLEQLSPHDAPNSLWIAVHGNVYDLTTFRSDHPGGTEALESCAGTDGTEAYECAGHGEANMAKMKQHRVGRLEGAGYVDLESSKVQVMAGGLGKDGRTATSKAAGATDRRKRATMTVGILLTLSVVYYSGRLLSAFMPMGNRSRKTPFLDGSAHNARQHSGQV